MRRPLFIIMLCGSLTACGPGIDATVKRNPVCDYSAIVTWTTDEPASSWVDFGSETPDSKRIGDDALVTDHEVIVLGMHADQSWVLQAHSESVDGRVWASDELTFDAGSLPEWWLAGEVHIDHPDQVQPGWTLASAMTGSISAPGLVMLDEEGLPVWSYLHDGDEGRADIQPVWLPEGQLLVGPDVAPGEHLFAMDPAGRVTWEGPEQPGDPDNNFNIQDGQYHHVFNRLDDGSFVTVQSEYRDGVQGDRVLIFDAALQERWSWSAFDHLVFDPDDLFLGMWWTHLNSVTVYEDQDLVFINSWVLGRSWKVQMSTGQVLWTLGEDQDFAPDPDNPYPWYELAHSFEPIGEDRYLLHDNGSTARGFSRVVEYTLDEANMQAEISWEYPGDLAEDRWYNISCGDVDLLDNGNLLVVADTRIMELTREGTLVWVFQWPELEDQELRSYQAQRMPALAEAL